MRTTRSPLVRAAALRFAALAGAVVLATLHGRVLDDTTGQPLAGVGVDVFAGTASSGKPLRHTATGTDGRFVLRGLHAGTYTFGLSSDDVPRADETVRVDSAHPRELILHECSTTLDYSCAPKFQAPAGGPGAGG